MQQENNPEETIENARDQHAGKEDNNTIRENVVAAHDAAEQDIEQDPDLGPAEDPGADLDEGELAALDNSNDEAEI